MTAKDKATLMQQMRERREKEGMVRIEVWVPRQYVERVRAFVARLAKRIQQ